MHDANEENAYRFHCKNHVSGSEEEDDLDEDEDEDEDKTDDEEQSHLEDINEEEDESVFDGRLLMFLSVHGGILPHPF